MEPNATLDERPRKHRDEDPSDTVESNALAAPKRKKKATSDMADDERAAEDKLMAVLKGSFR